MSNRLPVSALPIVATVKFNGRTLAERSPLQLLPTTTWEAAARLRLGEQASEFMSLPLQVHLYPNGQQRESDRVGASISDAVGGSFALGYAFAVLSFSAPVYGCARPAAKGVNAFPAAARAEGGTGELCLPELYTCGEERGSLSYELSLFNAVILQCDRQGLGIRRDEREGCGKVATRVRNALWLMAGREGEFKWSRVPLRFKEYGKPLDEGGFGVKLGKKPQGASLSQEKVGSAAVKLRTAVDITRDPAQICTSHA